MPHVKSAYTFIIEIYLNNDSLGGDRHFPITYVVCDVVYYISLIFFLCHISKKKKKKKIIFKLVRATYRASYVGYVWTS